MPGLQTFLLQAVLFPHKIQLNSIWCIEASVWLEKCLGGCKSCCLRCFQISGLITLLLTLYSLKCWWIQICMFMLFRLRFTCSLFNKIKVSVLVICTTVWRWTFCFPYKTQTTRVLSQRWKCYIQHLFHNLQRPATVLGYVLVFGNPVIVLVLYNHLI